MHPHRHILTRALGVQSDVAVDVWQIVPEEGDRFLLCSDGMTNEVPSDRITEVLSETRDPREAAEILVQMANQAGGNDNATVVVLDVMIGEPPSTEVDGTQGAEAGAGSAPWASDAHDGPAEVSATSGSTMVVSAPESSSPSPVALGAAGTMTADGVGAAVVSRSAPDTDLVRPPARQDQRSGARIPRRITFRVLLFLVVLGGLAYAGYAAIRWYVNSSYFVGISDNQVVIYQGRPGGFVGINPKIVKRTEVTTVRSPPTRFLTFGAESRNLPIRRRSGMSLASNSRCAVWNSPPPTAPPRRLCTTPGATTSTTLPTSTPATFGLRAPGRAPAVYEREAA